MTAADPALPTPARRDSGRVGLALLLAALALGPVAWIAQLLVTYGIASHACYPDGSPAIAYAIDGLWSVLLAANLVAVALTVAAALGSYRNYRAAGSATGRDEARARVAGRTQFLAAWGGMAGLGFLAGALVDLVALLVVPPCLG